MGNGEVYMLYLTIILLRFSTGYCASWSSFASSRRLQASFSARNGSVLLCLHALPRDFATCTSSSLFRNSNPSLIMILDGLWL